MEENKGSISRNIFQLLAVVLLLVVLPAGSWYYLKEGFDYRKAAMDDLQPRKAIAPFAIPTFSDSLFNSQTLKGHLTIANFFALDNEEKSKSYGELFAKMHRQFDKREDVLFLSYVLETDSTSAQKVANYRNQYGLEDVEQCIFVPGSSTAGGDQVIQDYDLPLTDGIALKDNPYLVLLDDSLQIRNYYDIRSEEDIKLLVAHTAMIMPKKPKKDIIYKPEKEK